MRFLPVNIQRAITRISRPFYISFSSHIMQPKPPQLFFSIHYFHQPQRHRSTFLYNGKVGGLGDQYLTLNLSSFNLSRDSCPQGGRWCKSLYRAWEGVGVMVGEGIRNADKRGNEGGRTKIYNAITSWHPPPPSQLNRATPRDLSFFTAPTITDNYTNIASSNSDS